MPSRTPTELTLVSHHLCPYVQRAIIALDEKGVRFNRVYVDLACKPDWFAAISPLGKTPVLLVGETPVFESAVILEYLEETQRHPLHPSDPLRRAEHRAWMEVGSSILDDISGIYRAADAAAFAGKAAALSDKFARIEQRLGAGPYFDGDHFSLVDVVFGPVFRYFDSFDLIGDFGVLRDKKRIAAWRAALSQRASVINAVNGDYADNLRTFLRVRNSYLSRLIVAADRAGSTPGERPRTE